MGRQKVGDGIKLQIRPLCRENAATVAALERKIFGTPWSEKTVEESIVRGESQERPGAFYAALGAFLKDELAGYLFAMAVAGEGELHRIGTVPAFRRKGVGDALMEAVVSWISYCGGGSIWLEVRAGNKAAVSLYKKHGFLETGRRKNYYQNPTEDACIFVYH